MSILEAIRSGAEHHTTFEIRKWESEDVFLAGDAPFDVVRHTGNLITSGGVTAIWQLLSAASGVTPYNYANAYVGVGDSTTASLSGMTDLQAATNKARVQVLSGSPGITGNTITFIAQFGSAAGNYDWNEFAVFNAAVSGVMLNRGVFTGGTKTVGQVWAAVTTIAIA